MDRSLRGYLASLKGKRAAVIGIGVSNTPLIKTLLRAGIPVTACDKNEHTVHSAPSTIGILNGPVERAALVGGLNDGAATEVDATHRLWRKPDDFGGFPQDAVIGLYATTHFPVFLLGGSLDDGANHCVQAWTIAATS